MTEEQFKKNIESLLEAYPGTPKGANWPAPRVQAFLDAFRFLTEEHFKSAIINYIANNFTPPTIDRFRLCVEEVRPKGFANKSLPDWCCSWCDQSGTVFTRAINSRREVLFGCLCEWVQIRGIRGITAWDASLNDRFEPIFWEMDCKSLRYKIPFKHHTAAEAKTLAEKYAPIIKAALRGIGKELPYDPKERISEFIDVGF
jgi:hypothetical protein